MPVRADTKFSVAFATKDGYPREDHLNTAKLNVDECVYSYSIVRVH
jgi:hypothetical protein